MTGSLALQKLVTISSESLAKANKIAEPIRKILFFSLEEEAIRPKQALALSIEPGHVSIVYGSRSLSRIRIKGARTSPFKEGTYPTPVNVASALALIRNEMKGSSPEITLSIPKAWAVAKLVELPVTVRENLPDVIFYELDRLTPFTPENAFYDFRIVGEEEGKLSIMLIAARADLVNPYLQAIRELGVTVDRLTVSPSAIGALCTYGHAGQDAIFANIGTEGYEVGLILDNLLTFYCAGSIDASDESSDLDRVVDEIKQCAETGNKRGSTPRLMLCTGDSEGATRLKMKVPTAIDIFEGMDARIHFPQDMGHISPSAAGSMLEALAPQEKGFNLLQKGRRERKKTPITFTLILVLALAAMGVLYVVAPLRVEETRLEQIDRRIASLRNEVKRVETLRKDVGTLETEIAAIEGFKKNRPMTLQLLKEVTTQLPRSTWLSRTRITDTVVEIEGYANTATELLPRLEGSPYLRKVEFASPTFRDSRLNADRFVIKMEIETPGKEPEGKVKQEPEGKVKK